VKPTATKKFSIVQDAERRWEAPNGIECAAVRNPFGSMNGYVRLPEGHIGRGMSYDDLTIEAHGGLTYGVDEEGWIGFDTLHSGDIWTGLIPVGTSESRRQSITREYNVEWRTEWNEDAVAAECERIAEQVPGATVTPCPECGKARP
jgi:hypothetical protein